MFWMGLMFRATTPSAKIQVSEMISEYQFNRLERIMHAHAIDSFRACSFFLGKSERGGVVLEMKTNSTPEIMIEAMKNNNATVAYFIIEKPRLGTDEYNRIVAQAQQNNLRTYQIFYYRGEEKLRMFYYKKNFPFVEPIRNAKRL